jgi:hypothetical protein
MAVSESLVGFLRQFPTIGRQPSRTRGYTLLIPTLQSCTYRQSQLDQVTGYPTQQAVLDIFLDPLMCIHLTQLGSLSLQNLLVHFQWLPIIWALFDTSGSLSGHGRIPLIPRFGQDSGSSFRHDINRCSFYAKLRRQAHVNQWLLLPGPDLGPPSHGDVTIFRELMPSFCCLRAKKIKKSICHYASMACKTCNIANRIESNRLERFTWPIRNCNSRHC